MSVHRFPSLNELPVYHVYALLCQDSEGPGYIKFGMSGDVTSRLSSLRSACPIPARLIATIEVGYVREKCLAVEKHFHEYFHDRKIKGEWFRFDFSNADDKRAFNEGSQLILASHFGDNYPWWEKVSVKALDKLNEERRRRFINSPYRKKLEAMARQEAERRRAWRELS